MLNDLSYENSRLLAENKKLKMLRNGVSSSVVDDIDELWRELVLMKREKDVEVQTARKKLIRAYIAFCLSLIICVVILITMR